MLRLHQYILALFVWLSFLFNIERLDVGGTSVLNLPSLLYLYVFGAVLFCLLMPRWARFPLSVYSGVGLPLYIGLRLMSGRPMWGGAQTYVFLFEVSSVLISIGLAYTVGNRLSDFLETVSALILDDMPNSVYRPKEADAWVRREMQYARREHYPLSVIVMEVEASDREVVLHETAQEIQKLLARRYNLMALTRLLAWRIRRTDFILDRSQEGRLVLVAPKAHQEQAPVIIQRVQRYAKRHLGISLRCGAATFPVEGLTFDEILHRAEQKLHPHSINRVQGRAAITDYSHASEPPGENGQKGAESEKVVSSASQAGEG